MRPWKLAELNYAHVKEQQYEVAVLPLGATEPHNLHLPYGTDMYEGDLIGDRVCQAAHDLGARVILLPTIPYGTETNMRQFPLAMNLNPSTLYQVCTDLIESLVQSGIRKIILMNMHGGNEMKPLVRELYGKIDAQLFICFWAAAIKDRAAEICEHPEDHAGEAETSIMLAGFDQLVGKNPDGSLIADQGDRRPMRFEALNQGWVSISRPWHLLTTNTGSGNPHAATAAKGQALIQAVVDRIAPFIKELSDATIDDTFPFANP